MYLAARIIATENKRRRWRHTRTYYSRGIPFRYNHRVDTRIRVRTYGAAYKYTRRYLLESLYSYIVRNGYNTRTYVRTYVAYVVYYPRGGSVAHADHKQRRDVTRVAKVFTASVILVHVLHV